MDTSPNITTLSAFDAPPDRRYFEHYVPGAIHEFGDIEVIESEVIDFALRFDPQFFHVDRVAAASGPFDGLIASGWHTVGLMMRACVEHYLSTVASLGSPGIDELRWTKPVRPGDRLRVRATVLSAKRSSSKPDRGIVRTRFEVLNQRDEVVMHLTTMNLLRCAPGSIA